MHPNIQKLRAIDPKTPVRFRTGIHGETEPKWNPWQVSLLYIVKRGYIITLTPQTEVHAEYGEHDFDPDACVFSNEEYCLEIDLTDH